MARQLVIFGEIEGTSFSWLRSLVAALCRDDRQWGLPSLRTTGSGELPPSGQQAVKPSFVQDDSLKSNQLALASANAPYQAMTFPYAAPAIRPDPEQFYRY